MLTAFVAGSLLMVQFEPVTLFGHAIPAGMFAGVNVAGVPLGPLGLAVGAAVGAWLEWGLLKRQLVARIGAVGTGAGQLARMAAAALAAAAVARVIAALTPWAPLPTALLVAAVFGAMYFAAARVAGLSEARALPAALLRRLRNGRS